MYLSSNFSSKHFFKVQVVQPYSSTDIATAWKNSCLILSEKTDFHMVVNLSISIPALPMRVLALFSVKF